MSDFSTYSIDEKILVFEDRAIGWIFNICEAIYEKEISHNGFAVLKILVSTFEMLGKHIKGYYKEKSKAFYHFDISFHAVYSASYDKQGSTLFYKYIRNPLYHTGYVGPNVLITDEISHAFGFNSKEILLLNVQKLLLDIKNGFLEYCVEVKKEKNYQLRQNFEKRFDYESTEFYRKFKSTEN